MHRLTKDRFYVSFEVWLIPEKYQLMNGRSLGVPGEDEGTVALVVGSGGMVSLKDSIFSLPGLVPLRDPAVFSGAVLGEYGWEAEWPLQDIQIGADTLLADMLDQRSETPADRFTVW